VRKSELLREIIDRLNVLFAGKYFTKVVMLSHANTIRAKVEEKEYVMELCITTQKNKHYLLHSLKPSTERLSTVWAFTAALR